MPFRNKGHSFGGNMYRPIWHRPDEAVFHYYKIELEENKSGLMFVRKAYFQTKTKKGLSEIKSEVAQVYHIPEHLYDTFKNIVDMLPNRVWFNVHGLKLLNDMLAFYKVKK